MAAAVGVHLHLPLMDTLKEEQTVKSSFESLISCLFLDSKTRIKFNLMILLSIVSESLNV